jgi:hypothetical protein
MVNLSSGSVAGRPGRCVDGLMGRDDADIEFAGELFLNLAEQGRLVVDAGRADRLIADLEATLAVLRARLRTLEAWRAGPAPAIDSLPAEVADAVVDAVFADQLAPGRLERASRELPKYVAALRAARR